MKNTSNNLEVEVKFYIHQPLVLRQRLVELDAKAPPKVFETNLRFDDRGHTLKSSGQLLRLRRDRDCRLTFKSKPGRSDPQFKVYRELEVSVSDFDTMQGILHGIGYHTAQLYEKWRQVFHWENVALCLDEMPYGAFLEIEGPPESIKPAADHLGLVWEKRILKNYLSMFETLRARENLPFHDVTFSNFENHPVDITPLLSMFEIGKKGRGGDENSE
jgi:adenylate cyclase class 2